MRDTVSLSAPDAERQMLGWALRDAALIRRYRARVAPADFADLRYRWAWQTACQLEADGLPVDPLAVAGLLEGQPVAEKVSLDFLRSLGDTPLDAGPDTCAAVITDKAMRRRLQAASSRLAALAFDADRSLDEIEAEARAIVRAAVVRRGRTEKLHAPAERAEAALQRYEQRAEGQGDEAVPFGWPEVDNLFGGARCGQYIVVAAASGHGKTSFMQTWAQWAGLAGKKVLYVSCEMGEGDLTDREVARWTNIPLTTLRRKLDARGMDGRLMQGAGAVSESNIWVWDEEPITPSVIEAVADEMQATIGLDIVFVDYLQIVSPDKELRDRRLEIEAVSKRLRLLARLLNVPVVAGSQLNLGYASRTDKRPQPQDLRESGQIYNDAWIVIGLFRPGALRGETGADGKQAPDNSIEVHALKNRQDGPTNTFRTLVWDGPITDVYDGQGPRLWHRLARLEGGDGMQKALPLTG